MATLILIRHGQSTWNAANKFTGWVDVPLSRLGRQEASIAAAKLGEFKIDICFTSLLFRAIETAMICLTEYEQVAHGKSPVLKHAADDPDWHGWDKYEGNPEEEIPVIPAMALDERYYGDLQGFNKAKTAEKYGEEIVQEWRRSYYTRPPGGESLSDTADRTIPFFKSRILTHITEGDNVLVAAHGNSLRSIVMHLERLPVEQVPGLELKTGVPIVYEINGDAQITSKTVLEGEVNV
jgi:2,3-bisphosphoglycerate-dependent phosphoglycerate mutase